MEEIRAEILKRWEEKLEKLLKSPASVTLSPPSLVFYTSPLSLANDKAPLATPTPAPPPFQATSEPDSATPGPASPDQFFQSCIDFGSATTDSAGTDRSFPATDDYDSIFQMRGHLTLQSVKLQWLSCATAGDATVISSDCTGDLPSTTAQSTSETMYEDPEVEEGGDDGRDSPEY